MLTSVIVGVRMPVFAPIVPKVRAWISRELILKVLELIWFVSGTERKPAESKAATDPGEPGQAQQGGDATAERAPGRQPADGARGEPHQIHPDRPPRHHLSLPEKLHVL